MTERNVHEALDSTQAVLDELLDGRTPHEPGHIVRSAAIEEAQTAIRTLKQLLATVREL